MKEIVKVLNELDPRIRVQVEFIEKGVIMDIFIDGRWKVTIVPKSFKKAKRIALQYRTIDAVREELRLEEAARIEIEKAEELEKLLEELFPVLSVEDDIFHNAEQFINYVNTREIIKEVLKVKE